MNEDQVIDATVPDHSNDEKFWAQCFIEEVNLNIKGLDYPLCFIDCHSLLTEDGVADWFRRALATGARQALIDVSLIEACRCSVSPTKYVLMYPKLTIEGERYMLQCQACDVFVRADSIEELRIAWNARMQ